MPMNSRSLPILSSIHKEDTIEETTSDTGKEKTSNKVKVHTLDIAPLRSESPLQKRSAT